MHDLCDTGAVLDQLSFQANNVVAINHNKWSLVNIPLRAAGPRAENIFGRQAKLRGQIKKS